MNKNNNSNKPLVTALSCCFALTAYLIAESVIAEEIVNKDIKQQKVIANVAKVMTQVHHCNDSITMRSQSLSFDKLSQACEALISQKDKFN